MHSLLYEFTLSHADIHILSPSPLSLPLSKITLLWKLPSAIFTLCCSFKELMQWCSHDVQLATWYLLSHFPTICTHVLQDSNVSHDSSMDLGHGLNWMSLKFHVDCLLRLKWTFRGWHGSHYKAFAQLPNIHMLTQVWRTLAFHGKEVSSEAEAVS